MRHRREWGGGLGGHVGGRGFRETPKKKKGGGHEVRCVRRQTRTRGVTESRAITAKLRHQLCTSTTSAPPFPPP